MHPVALPACSCLFLAKELLVMLAPQLPAQVSLATLRHSSRLEDAGWARPDQLAQLHAQLEHRFRLHLAAPRASTTWGELVDDLYQGLSGHPIALPALC